MLNNIANIDYNMILSMIWGVLKAVVLATWDVIKSIDYPLIWKVIKSIYYVIMLAVEDKDKLEALAYDIQVACDASSIEKLAEHHRGKSSTIVVLNRPIIINEGTSEDQLNRIVNECISNEVPYCANDHSPCISEPGAESKYMEYNHNHGEPGYWNINAPLEDF